MENCNNFSFRLRMRCSLLGPAHHQNCDSIRQSSLNKSTAQIWVTAKSVVDSAEQFEFRPIRNSKFQINQLVAFKIRIVQLNLIY